MQACLMFEPQQGGTYDQLLAASRWAERLGFHGVFRSDHWLPMGVSPAHAATDAWATLAGLARETRRVRLGLLVTPITFRHPSAVAKMAATIDQMSGGRLELGYGAGWYEAEHRAYGIPFPPAPERMDRLEEALQVVRALFGPGLASFDGRHYRLQAAPGQPKPAQERLPIIVGGGGPRRTPRLAAQYADEYNSGGDLNAFGERRAQVVAACERLGRDPTSLRYSWMGAALVGRDEAEVERRAVQLGAAWGRPRDEALTMLGTWRQSGVVGTPDQARAMLDRLAAAGCQRVYLQFLLLDDREMIELLAEILGLNGE